jgi:hypothetical protein
MATQIIMDHNGDTRHNFDPADATAVLKAERRFKKLPAPATSRQPAPLMVRSLNVRLIQPQKKPCFTRDWSAVSRLSW